MRWIPAFFWMGTIFYLSAQTGEKLGSFLPFLQIWFPAMTGFNWGHYIAYFILSATYYFALGPDCHSLKGKIIAVGLSALYGITDEFHQLFVPGRTADIYDLRNDLIGAALAMVVLSFPPAKRIYRKLDWKNSSN